MASTFDFADPDLWKSNSFASLHPRLAIHVRAAIAKLKSQIASAARRAMAQPFNTSGKSARESRRRACEREIAELQPKLDRALVIYRNLTGCEWEPSAMALKIEQIMAERDTDDPDAANWPTAKRPHKDYW